MHSKHFNGVTKRNDVAMIQMGFTVQGLPLFVATKYSGDITIIYQSEDGNTYSSTEDEIGFPYEIVPSPTGERQVIGKDVEGNLCLYGRIPKNAPPVVQGEDAYGRLAYCALVKRDRFGIVPE